MGTRVRLAGLDAGEVVNVAIPPGPADRFRVGLRIREDLVHSGAYYLVKARVRGRTYLRTTIINPRTTEADLSELLVAIRAAAGRVLAGGTAG